jgi:hypothetical protein
MPGRHAGFSLYRVGILHRLAGEELSKINDAGAVALRATPHV